MRVFTVGHSTRTFEELLGILRSAGVTAVADVRRFPASRRHPQFGKEALASALEANGVAYRWFPELGGRRPAHPGSPHVGWRVAAFRGYADHMGSQEFRAALARLLEWAHERAVAIVCAEAVPWRCHRQLIADAITVAGFEVRHLLAEGSERRHALPPFARVDAGRVMYDAGQLSL